MQIIVLLTAKLDTVSDRFVLFFKKNKKTETRDHETVNDNKSHSYEIRIHRLNQKIKPSFVCQVSGSKTNKMEVKISISKRHFPGTLRLGNAGYSWPPSHQLLPNKFPLWALTTRINPEKFNLWVSRVISTHNYCNNFLCIFLMVQLRIYVYFYCFSLSTTKSFLEKKKKVNLGST